MAKTELNKGSVEVDLDTDNLKDQDIQIKEEKKEEAPTESSDNKDEAAESGSDEQKEVEVPEKFKALVEQIEQMSVMDLSELVKILVRQVRVSSAAPM